MSCWRKVVQILLLLLILVVSAESLSSTDMPPRYSTRSARMSTVKITTYNVLSSHLAAPGWFQACKPEFLDPKYRLESLKRKLDEECASNSVICLQEVSHSWAGPLHSYFANRDYHLVTALYGNRMNNYMGVAIAVPLQKYDILDVNIQKVSDTKIMPKKPKITFFQEFLMTVKSFIVKLSVMFKLYRPPIDIWDNILYRHNQMICARLKDKNSSKSFVVGTYHMPCMFDKPAVMVTHTALSAQHIQRYAERLAREDARSCPASPSQNSSETDDELKIDPIIFCGDYNFKPSSSEYELITTGKLDKQVCCSIFFFV